MSITPDEPMPMPSLERRYEYDQTGRLISMTDGENHVQYNYDDRDNLLERSTTPVVPADHG